MMNKYILDIDELFDSGELFHILEMKSDGGRSHECQINAASKEEAVFELFTRLNSFLQKKFYLQDTLEEDD